MRLRAIPPAKPYFPEEDIEKIKEGVGEILRSGMLTMYKYTKEFERRFSGYVGAKYAIAVNSGTSALEIALRSLGLEKGGVVLVPTNTFTSTAAAVVFAGGRPVLTDIDPETLCMDSKDFETD